MTLSGPIILEGADGVGKTTLANELRRRFGGHYIHLRRHIDLFNWWFAALARARRYRRGPGPVIIDRHWPSHLIYQSVYDKNIKLDLVAPSAHALFTKMGGVYVFCVPDTIEEVVEKHAQLKTQRKEMYESKMDLVASAYEALWEGVLLAGPTSLSRTYEAMVSDGGARTWPNAVRYRVGKTTYEEIIDEIIKAQQRYEHRTSPTV